MQHHKSLQNIPTGSLPGQQVKQIYQIPPLFTSSGVFGARNGFRLSRQDHGCHHCKGNGYGGQEAKPLDPHKSLSGGRPKSRSTTGHPEATCVSTNKFIVPLECRCPSKAEVKPVFWNPRDMARGVTRDCASKQNVTSEADCGIDKPVCAHLQALHARSLNWVTSGDNKDVSNPISDGGYGRSVYQAAMMPWDCVKAEATA